MQESYYYGMLKNGSLVQYAKAPKKRIHVAMKTFAKGPGKTVHVLDCGGKSKTFIAHCGYDRGPRLENIIKKMLEEAV